MENENMNTSTTETENKQERKKAHRNYYILDNTGDRVINNLKDQKECINWIKENGSIDVEYGIYYSVFVESKMKSTRIVMK